MSLTNLEIRNAKPGMHSDGNGLYLLVRDGGAKSWIFRYTAGGKRREMGLGALAALDPVDARADAGQLRKRIVAGFDPIDERLKAKTDIAEAKRQVQLAEKRASATFQQVSSQYIAAHEGGWRNAKHRQQWENTLKTYAFPVIGDMPVCDIEVEHVLEVLKPIWTRKHETARRVRMRIEAVLDSAKVKKLREGDNPAIWRGGLESLLPTISKSEIVRSHPAMPWDDISAFMPRLKTREGISARALEFAILTAARSGEVRRACWSEINLEKRLWLIPREKMKAKREHRVPLSKPAIELLESMPMIYGCPYIFPGTRNQPLSDMSLGAVLRRMDLGHYTVHGFRSTFRDWASEVSDHKPEAIELALAHSIANKTEAAYRRGDQLEKRVALMEDWASWCSSLTASESSRQTT